MGDFAGSFDEDEDDLERRFRTPGVDFRTEVLPGVRNEAVPDLPGASRLLLTAGTEIHSGIRLAADVPSRLLDLQQRSALSRQKSVGASADIVFYAATLPDPALASARGRLLLSLLASNAELEWRSVAVPAMARPPRVVERDGVRYSMVMDERAPIIPTTELLLIAAKSR